MEALPATPTGPALDVDWARKLTERIKSSAEELWKLLLEAHDGQAWQALDYPSWASYVGAEFSMTKRQANRLIQHARLKVELEAVVGPVGPTITERATRNLTPDQRKTIVAEVQALANPSGWRDLADRYGTRQSAT